MIDATQCFTRSADFLDESILTKIVSTDTFRSFALGAADARFLFNDQLAAYLEEMRDRAAKARAIYITMDSAPDMSPGQKAAASTAA
jgi:hypothetical protein